MKHHFSKNSLVLSSLLIISVLFACSAAVRAGISSLNVLVVANKNHQESLLIAEYYMSRRDIPASHLLLLDLPAYKNPQLGISYEDYLIKMRGPIIDRLDEPRLKHRIHALVFTKWVPVDIKIPDKGNVSILQDMTIRSHEKKAMSPHFGRNTGFDFSSQGGGNPPVFSLTGWDGEDIQKLISRSASADGTFPDGTFYMLNGLHARSVRKQQMPQILEIASKKNIKVKRLKGASIKDTRDIMGYFTGVPEVDFTGDVLLSGAIGDHLTSFGGMLYNRKSGQMSVLEYIHNGASMTYGTMHEPTNWLPRHVNLSCILYYATGFTAGEAYTINIGNPVYGVIVGDPLTCPYAPLPRISRNGSTVTIKTTDDKAPILRVELWQDGYYVRDIFDSGNEDILGLAVVSSGAKREIIWKANDELSDFLSRAAEEINISLPEGFAMRSGPDSLRLVSKNRDSLVLTSPLRIGVPRFGPVTLMSVKKDFYRLDEKVIQEWTFTRWGLSAAGIELPEGREAPKGLRLNVVLANQARTMRSVKIPR